MLAFSRYYLNDNSIVNLKLESELFSYFKLKWMRIMR